MAGADAAQFLNSGGIGVSKDQAMVDAILLVAQRLEEQNALLEQLRWAVGRT